MKKIIKIGFDVSTKQSGFAMFINDKRSWSGAIKQINQNANFAERMALDLVIINNTIIKLLKPLMEIEKELIDEWNKKIDINNLRDMKDKPKAIEKANKLFKEVMGNYQIICVFEANKIMVSQETKQKLDLYVGMFMGVVADKLALLCPSIPKQYKLTLPGEWHRKTFGVEYHRDEGKARSISKAMSIMSDDILDPENYNMSDDEADAINIAWIAQDLRDMGIVKSQLQHKAKRLSAIRPQISKLEGQKIKLEIEASARLKAGKQEWLTQKLIQYDSTVQRIKDLKKEKDELQNGTKRNWQKN